MTVQFLIGDCRAVLRAMQAESVDCVVTSPPYWGLRDYGVDGQIGLERTLGEHIEIMVEIFREIRRVVRPGGKVVCLELTQLRAPLWGPLFSLYFGRVVPLIGKLVAGDSGAYTYLPESVAAFLRPEGVAAEMARAGLREIRWRRLGFGTVTLHIGTA